MSSHPNGAWWEESQEERTGLLPALVSCAVDTWFTSSRPCSAWNEICDFAKECALCRGPGSNWRHMVLQTIALPTELPRRGTPFYRSCSGFEIANRRFGTSARATVYGTKPPQGYAGPVRSSDSFTRRPSMTSPASAIVISPCPDIRARTPARRDRPDRTAAARPHPERGSSAVRRGRRRAA